MSNKKLLTFEISNDNQELDIHCNKQGLEDLIYYCKRLLEGSTSLPNHDHLMTPSWAGDELSEEKQGEDSILLNKVTIRLWN